MTLDDTMKALKQIERDIYERQYYYLFFINNIKRINLIKMQEESPILHYKIILNFEDKDLIEGQHYTRDLNEVS